MWLLACIIKKAFSKIMGHLDPANHHLKTKYIETTSKSELAFQIVFCHMKHVKIWRVTFDESPVTLPGFSLPIIHAVQYTLCFL